MSAARPLYSGWLEEAACVGSTLDFCSPIDEAAAVEVCRTCPVTAECLDDALAFETQCGVRGGLSARQRGREDSRRTWWELKECGTEAAYKRHRRKGDDACRACKEAHALYVKFSRPNRARVSA